VASGASSTAAAGARLHRDLAAGHGRSRGRGKNEGLITVKPMEWTAGPRGAWWRRNRRTSPRWPAVETRRGLRPWGLRARINGGVRVEVDGEESRRGRRRRGRRNLGSLPASVGFRAKVT
jgi:hypothetical protein